MFVVLRSDASIEQVNVSYFGIVDDMLAFEVECDINESDGNWEMMKMLIVWYHRLTY